MHAHCLRFARRGGPKAYNSGVEACIRVAAATGFEGVPTSGHIGSGQRDRAGRSRVETGGKVRFVRKESVKPQVRALLASGSNLLGSTAGQDPLCVTQRGSSAVRVPHRFHIPKRSWPLAHSIGGLAFGVRTHRVLGDEGWCVSPRALDTCSSSSCGSGRGGPGRRRRPPPSQSAGAARQT